MGAIAVSTVLITVASFAIAAEGAPAADVDLNDGGAWVTRSSALMVGHINKEAALLDGALLADSADVDILQSGSHLLLTSPGKLTPIDVVTHTLEEQVAIPEATETSLGDRTLALHDQDSGNLWVLPVTDLSGFLPTRDATATLGSGSRVTVGRDGTVHAVDPEAGEFITIPTNAGKPRAPQTTAVDGLGKDHVVSITAVGGTAVVLDETTGTLQTADGALTTIDEPSPAALQLPSDAADRVALALPDALVTVPLAPSAAATAGAIRRTDAGGTGTVTAPVQMAECVYAAWGGSQRLVRACSGIDDDLATDLDTSSGDAVVTFRVNRQTIVLNEIGSGTSWLVEGDLTKVDNWSEATPPEGDSEDGGSAARPSDDIVVPQRSEDNTEPSAQDDDFGVRAGRTIVLPVTDNDSDPDGDILTVSLPNGQPSWGTVTPILNAQALQIEVPAEQTGRTVFTYDIDDGRGGRASATATVTVHPDAENAKPAQHRETTIRVDAGAQVTYNVLPDWRDPDGDDIFLQAARSSDDNEVRSLPDGRITFTAGATPGLSTVAVVVSDGASTSPGTVTFQVTGAGGTDPRTHPDHVVVRSGGIAMVSPLDNDESGSRIPLALAQVSGPASVQVVTDQLTGTFTVTSSEQGTHYVLYTARAGDRSSPGVVRVDVIEPASADAAPVAVRDIAVLQPGGDVLVDALHNDRDPAGGVLVLQSVTVPDGSSLSAAVVGNGAVRITDTSGLASQERLTYRISNGSQTATGDIIVLPLATGTDEAPPVAEADALQVRANDVGTIDVLANDTSPNGSRLTLDPELVTSVDPALGESFVSNGKLRVRASDTPMTGIVQYTVRDENGQTAVGTVQVGVKALDGDNSASPQPREVAARAIAGRPTVIVIPLDGIDPDGDSVELVGPSSAPAQGSVTVVGDASLTYVPDATASGTDVFSYRVRDRLGAESTATIRVGIAPPELINQAPTAVSDNVSVRPGREIDVAVIANDTDPDGDTIALVDDSVFVPDIAGLSAHENGDIVTVSAPDAEGQYVLRYTIEDARGSRATGTIQLTVDSSVPLAAPQARDDWVDADQVAANGTATVDILSNDVDPDGAIADVTITVVGQAAEVSGDRTLSVPVTAQRQLIEYRIQDVDGGEDRAFVFVPAITEMLPAVITGGGTVTVDSGERVEISLADHVRVVGGGEATLNDDVAPSALHSDGEALRIDDRTLAYRSAPDYVGTDTLTFSVRGGAAGSETTALLSLTITVTGTPTTPLQVSGSTMTLGQGEPAQSLSLRALVADAALADDAALRFRLRGAIPPGITAALEGSTLTVSAREDASVGPAGRLTFEVDDGERDPVEAPIEIVVTPTLTPRAVTSPDSATTRPGNPVTVNVTANDTRATADAPLRVVGATVTAGEATVTHTADSVTVTPASGARGTVQVTYRVDDGSGDASRDVIGLLSVAILTTPSAPGTPQIGTTARGQAMLTWSVPSSPGGVPVTGYRVWFADGTLAAESTSPSATVTGLSDGASYQFRVTAVNAEGESSPSGLSELVTAWTAPRPPTGVTVTAGAGSATVTWTPIQGATGYRVLIAPAPDAGAGAPIGTATSMTWTGLTNGTPYRFQVKALYGAVESDPTPWTTPVTPAASPDRMTAPQGRTVGLATTVTWARPGDGGSAIEGYELIIVGTSSGRRAVSYPAGATTATVDILPGDSEITISMRARNRYGYSPVSPATVIAGASAETPPTTPPAPTTPPPAATPPPQPSTPAALAAPGQPSISGYGGSVRIDFAGSEGAEYYEYSMDGQPRQQIQPGGSAPAADGSWLSVIVWAVRTVDGQRQESPASERSASYLVTPPPSPPTVTASAAGPGQLALTWSHGDMGYAHAGVLRYRLRASDGWTSASTSGSQVLTVPAGTYTVEMENSNDVGTWSSRATVTVTIP